MARGPRMKCKPQGKGGDRLCSAGGRTFVLHAGKSNHASKVRRGKKLASSQRCERAKTTGRYKWCVPKRGSR